jgi:hypothetical protein
VGEVHTIHFDTLGEFSDQRHAVHALILVIFRWVSTKVSLNGKQVTTDGISSLVYEIDRLRDNAGAADIAFNDGVIIYTPKPEPDWDEGCVYPKETITVEPVKDDGMGNLLPEGIESSAAPL